MFQDRLREPMDIEFTWLASENSINFWLHIIYAAALLGIVLFRNQYIKYPIAYRMAVIVFAFGWLLPNLVQWSILAISITFVDNNVNNMRRPQRELLFLLPWAYVLGICFKGLSVLLFVASLGFRTSTDQPPAGGTPSIALDE